MLLALFFVLAAHTHSAEIYEDPPVVSPDESKKVGIRFWTADMGTEWSITLSQSHRVLYRRHLPDKLDVRYVKVSWAPSSQALLLGENYKDGMDLTLLRIRHRHVRVTHFDLADRMVDKEARELPIQAALQSDAPVERVMWSSLKWLSSTRCTMLYIMHGLGYEGEGNVTIDFHGKRPVMKTSHLRPLSNPDSFNAGD